MYCKVRHTRSDVRCTKTFFKEKDVRNLMFPQYLNHLPALNSFFAVVAWQELGLQYRGAVSLARNIPGISQTPNPAPWDEKTWVRMHVFPKSRVPDARVFSCETSKNNAPLRLVCCLLARVW